MPDDFRFGLKVTDSVTIKKFPNQPRFGLKAGKANEHFLKPEVIKVGFLKPCEYLGPKLGVILFEFSRFWPTDYEHGRDFLAELDAFLEKLPPGWPYAIELRNKHWLVPDYFACLAKHKVAHVFNSWEAALPVQEQMALPGSRPNPELCAARFLLKPGRKYEEAVTRFSPYSETKEVNEEARKAGRELIRQSRLNRVKTFIYINNRLEGNALNTIAAMLDILPEDER